MRRPGPLAVCFGISIVLHALLFITIAVKGPRFGVLQNRAAEKDGAVTLTLLTAPDEPPKPKVKLVMPPSPPVPAPQPMPEQSETVSVSIPVPVSIPPVAETKPAAPSPVVSSAVEAKPNYLRNPPPVYPETARRRHQEGLVILAVAVSDQGHVEKVVIKQSSGFPLLDQAAAKAVGEWEFEPARLGPVALRSEIEVPVRFKLQ